jgi:hypothetical protein
LNYKKPTKPFQRLEMFSLREYQDVLRITPFYIWIIPDTIADRVDGDISFSHRQFRPILRPLLVNMAPPSLIGNCCAEQDYRTEEAKK